MQATARLLFQRVGHFDLCKRYLFLTSFRRSSDYILRSSLSDIVIPNVSLTDRLWYDLEKYKHLIAVECAESGKKYTYNQLKSYAAGFATSLRKSLGLSSGDMVAALVHNCPEFPVVAFGTVQAGCVLTTMNPIYTSYELSHQLNITKPKVVITVPECYENLIKALYETNMSPRIIIIDSLQQPVPHGTLRYTELAEKSLPNYKLLDCVRKDKEDTAFIPFSSGTTGLPKGVEITNKNALAAMEMMSVDPVCYPLPTTGTYQDVVPCVLPFFHIYGLVVVLMGHLALGCKLVTLPKFSASLYMSVLKEKKASLLYVVPPIAMFLAKHPDVGRDHLKYVHKLITGAAPLAASDVEPLLEKANNNLEILQGFGATETTSLATATLKGSRVNLSASGVPMSNTEIMFQDPATEKPVSIGEFGELLVRSPTVMKGYYKNKEATKNAFTSDGFLKTGDLALFKPGEGLFICDRIKELIKVKGMQVAPAELESLVRSHPAVADVAVIGVPHELHGEIPKALVVLKKGITASSEDIQRFVASKVAKYKHIEEVQFIDRVPKTASGKILRKELKEKFIHY